MADTAPALARYADPDSAAALRTLLGHATAHLLGDTIALTEEQWRGPSRLPGWSRGHVATHLARNADALARLVNGALTGEAAAMYPSPEARDAEIEAGAGRDGEDLQTDLDTTAAALDALFERAGHEGVWARTVAMRATPAPVGALVAARLAEVVLHHVDLDSGTALGTYDDATLTAVLGWLQVRLTPGLDRPLLVHAGESELRFGPETGEPVEVSGELAPVVDWLAGRGQAPAGAEGITPPAF